MLSYLSIILICLSASNSKLLAQKTLQEAFNSQFCAGCCQNHKQINMQNIQNIAALTGYNVSEQTIKNNPYYSSITFNISLLIIPATISREKYTFIMSYLLVYPNFKDPKLIKGIIGYFHPTIFNKGKVPTAEHLNDEFLALIGLYTSNGYIMVFPDYLGMGKYGYEDMHPYILYPEVNVLSMVRSLNSAYSKIINQTKPIKEFKVFIVGYSEGGGYAIWFKYCQETKSCGENLRTELKLTANAGLEGAYDLEDVQINFLLDNVTLSPNPYSISSQLETNIGKPGLTALTIASYATYANPPINLKSLLNQQFFDMNCSNDNQAPCNCLQQNSPFSSHRNISNALVQRSILNLGEAFSFDAFQKELDGKRYMKEGQVAFSPDNSVQSFVKWDILDKQVEFHNILKAATLTNKENPKIYANNTFVFTLQKDSLVSPKNFDSFVKFANVSSTKFHNKNYTVCTFGSTAEVDHIRGEIIANIYALNYFNSFNKAAAQERRFKKNLFRQ